MGVIKMRALESRSSRKWLANLMFLAWERPEGY